MDAAWEDPIKRDRHGIRLRWFAASKLTLARPKAPHVAGRALSASAGERVNRPTHIAMRPLRQKSSRFLSRGALEASQSRGLISRLTGAPARLLNGAPRDCVYARAVDVTQCR